MSLRKLWLSIALSSLFIQLGGCSHLLKTEKEKVKGVRVAALTLDDNKLKADSSLSGRKIELPDTVLNNSWEQTGGNAAHDIGHPLLKDRLNLLWSVSASEGINKKNPYQSQPVVANGNIFVLSTDASVSAFSIKDGKLRWKVQVSTPEQDSRAFSGGLAYDNGRLLVTYGTDDIVAIDAKNGGQVWRISTDKPVVSAPALSNNRLVISTLGNDILCFDSNNGKMLWRQAGVAETTSLLGRPPAAIRGNLVVVILSSGEVLGLGLENGRILWSDNLGGIRKIREGWGLNDSSSWPVITDDRVYLAGLPPHLLAINSQSGGRDWDTAFSTLNPIQVAGDYIYGLSNQQQLAAINATNGKINWVQNLEADEDNKANAWQGPLVAGDKVLVADSSGHLLTFDALNGKKTNSLSIENALATSPIIVGNSLFLLDTEGKLMAYKGQ